MPNPSHVATWPSLPEVPSLYPDARNRLNRGPYMYRAGKTWPLSSDPDTANRVASWQSAATRTPDSCRTSCRERPRICRESRPYRQFCLVSTWAFARSAHARGTSRSPWRRDRARSASPGCSGSRSSSSTSSRPPRDRDTPWPEVPHWLGRQSFRHKCDGQPPSTHGGSTHCCAATAPCLAGRYRATIGPDLDRLESTTNEMPSDWIEVPRAAENHAISEEIMSEIC